MSWHYLVVVAYGFDVVLFGVVVSVVMVGAPFLYAELFSRIITRVSSICYCLHMLLLVFLHIYNSFQNIVAHHVLTYEETYFNRLVEGTK